MNPLYDAIVSLGRSIPQFEKGRWTKGTIYDATEGMCANGLLTFFLPDAQLAPSHISAVADHTSMDQRKALQIAATALVAAATKEAWDTAFRCSDEFQQEWMTKAKIWAPHAPLDALDLTIVRLNDSGDMNLAAAKQWFSDAIDLLAEQLPVPERPVFKASVAAELALV